MSFAGWMLLFMFMLLILKILYLHSAKKTLEALPSEARSMEPGSVWYALLPFVHLGWNFMIVIHLRRSFLRLPHLAKQKSRVTGGFVSGMISSIAAVVGAANNLLSSILSKTNDLASGEALAYLALLSLGISIVWIVGWVVNWIMIVTDRKAIAPD